MNVRKFIASSIAEALTQVKSELGEEAVILRTRTVKQPGVKGMVSREQVEVMAATPDRTPPDPTTTPEHVSRFLNRMETRPVETGVDRLRDELSELKTHLNQIEMQVKLDRAADFPAPYARRFKSLVASGVEEKIALEIIEAVQLRLGEKPAPTKEAVDKAVVKEIASRLKTRFPERKCTGKAQVIALIGPTGVGKTTTLAKLVTSYRHWGGANTALVSADTYRVAALEQIKTFAAIAGLPMEAVYSPSAMPTALAKHKDREAIFVDTPGRSQSDTQKLDELASFLNASGAEERLICLSVNTRIEDQFDILSRYGRLSPTGIIFTKFDDSRFPGGILSIASQSDIPIAYVTCGQNVPDDLVAAEPNHLAQAILDPPTLAKLQKNRFSEWLAADEARVAGGANGR